MKGFIPASDEQAQEITSAIVGKVVQSVLLYDNRGDDYLEITFTDGSHFKIRYDWIREWEAG